MKTFFKVQTLLAVLAFSIQPSAFASSYVVTNDLAVMFTVAHWTNSAGIYTFDSWTNLAPNTATTFAVNTNGVTGMSVQATNATTGIIAPYLFTNSVFTNLNFGSSFVSAIFAAALSIDQPLIETVPQVQNILKSYYVTGAIPTQQNYWEWLDTMYWYVNYMSTNATAAATSAANAAKIFQAQVKYYCTNIVPNGTTHYTNSIVILQANNIASMTVTNPGLGSGGMAYWIEAVFTTPITNGLIYPCADLVEYWNTNQTPGYDLQGAAFYLSSFGVTTAVLVPAQIGTNIPEGFYIQ